MWEELDRFSMEDIFRTRGPHVEELPALLRGRLHESFQVALRERHRAKMVQDEQAEIQAWKLFGLVPLMLLHRPMGNWSGWQRRIVSPS